MSAGDKVGGSMQIINPAVARDIAAGKGLRLNLGSGKRPRDGFYSVDHLPLPGVDVVADLNEPLAGLPDNSVEAVYSRHTLEHVAALLPLMAEIHRVCRPEARVEVVVPHFSNPYTYSDPTHVRFFGLYTFFYFADEADQPARKVPSFYVAERFRIEEVTFSLLRHGPVGKLARLLLGRLINRSPGWLDWYERCLCRWLPVDSVRYVLRPKKATGAGGEPRAA
jgi:SAM-dependent methyltransferase